MIEIRQDHVTGTLLSICDVLLCGNHNYKLKSLSVQQKVNIQGYPMRYEKPFP